MRNILNIIESAFLDKFLFDFSNFVGIFNIRRQNIKIAEFSPELAFLPYLHPSPSHVDRVREAPEQKNLNLISALKKLLFIMFGSSSSTGMSNPNPKTESQKK